MQSFPEVDRAAWYAVDEARVTIQPGQAPFLERLRDALAG
jgi:predicted NUDIX family NTP pyrophosphohydrolase